MDKTALAFQLFDKHAEAYQAKYMDVSMYHHSFDLFCHSIAQENADVLEVACGPGNITRYLLQKRPDFKILGTDLSPNMIELARINNPTALFQVMDCMDMAMLDRKFNAIICGFGLPYLSKEAAIQLIQDAAGMLKPACVLYISTMEDDYLKSGLQTGSNGDQLYIYYHQADYLTAALQANGFHLIDLQRRLEERSDGSQTTDLLIIAGNLIST